MRYWMYVEPAGSSIHPVYTIMSDKAVLATYFPYWSSKMMQKHGGWVPEITEENCIIDWAIVNWAEEVTHQALQRILEDG